MTAAGTSKPSLSFGLQIILRMVWRPSWTQSFSYLAIFRADEKLARAYFFLGNSVVFSTVVILRIVEGWMESKVGEVAAIIISDRSPSLS